jgi:putative membrane protein
MKHIIAALSLLILLTACREKAGEPQTETTGTAQAAQETSTATATTTGVTGGTSSALAPDDKEFVSKAGMGGLAEVQMGNLALSKASSADVKAFGQRMVTDHSKANEELQQLATAKGVALPTELAGEEQATMTRLSSLSGAEFDKAYMKDMVEDHEKDVAEFDKASTTASDSDLKAWAAKTLPTLKEHLQHAKTVSSKLR